MLSSEMTMKGKAGKTSMLLTESLLCTVVKYEMECGHLHQSTLSLPPYTDKM